MGALGGYAFSAGVVAVIAAGLPHFGLVKSESAILGGMLGMLVYLSIIIWMVASTKPIRASIVILFAAVLMLVGAPLMATV